MSDEPGSQERRSGILRKAAIAVVGGTVTATGIVLIPLPGPGTLIALGGLAILGTEFPSARRVVNRARDGIGSVLGRTSEPEDEADDEA